MKRNRSLLSLSLCNKWQTKKREMKWPWVARLFNIALLFIIILPTTLIAASGLCDDENYKNMLAWQSLTENSYTEVAAPRLGRFTSHTKCTLNLEVSSAFFLQTQRSVSCYSSIYIPSYIELICTSFTIVQHDRILATDTNPMQQSSFVVNKIISSGHHNFLYRCKVASA